MAEHNEFGKEGEEEAAAYRRRISKRTNCYRGKDPQEY